MAGGAKLAACKTRYASITKSATQLLDDLERSSNNFYGATTGSFNLLLEGMNALADELLVIGQPNANTPIAAANPNIVACLRGIAEAKHRARNDSTIYWTAAGRLTHLIADLNTLITDVDGIIKKKEGKLLTQKTLPQLKDLAKELGRVRGEWALLTQIGPHRITHPLLA